MTIKEYNLQKTAKKTATVNNLLFVDGNGLTNHKLLFDFSFLDTLEISENEKDAIKEEAVKHCSVANRTAFIFYNADKWTVCDAIAGFNYHRVYNSNTWKLAYVILELKHVKYYHAERCSVYDKFYTENIKEFEADSKMQQPIMDLEI